MPRMGRRRKEVDQSTYSGRVAVRLRSLREKAGKTVPEMAKAVGMSRASWYQYEDGRHSPPIDLLPTIASVLGVAIRSLLPPT